MFTHRPQHSPAGDIKHLHDPIVPSGNYQLAILPKLCASCRVLEPGYSLDDLSRLGRIDEYSRGRADGVSMWPGWAEMDVRDGGWVLDE
jgi:hypothetical protein